MAKIDIVIFGASGFTGARMIPYIAKYARSGSKKISWGVAGRSESKLKETLKQNEKEIGQPIDAIPIIVADVKNEKSLQEMAQKAKVIINCSGPYDYFGEPVVKACVEAGTHHVDVSAEVQFMEEMQLKYHAKAQETGAYIISACGYASVPADLGVNFLEKNFEGTLNSVVGYYRIWEEGPGAPGPLFNKSTWESLLGAVEAAPQLKKIRQQLFGNNSLPEMKPKLELQKLPHEPKATDGWAVPFEITDVSVIARSQRFFYEEEAKRPIQFESYANIKSTLYLLVALFVGTIVILLTTFAQGLKILYKFPRFFTLGIIGEDDHPSDEKLNNLRFSIILHGEGWKEKLANPKDQYNTPPDASISCEVKGPNPGYGSACVCLGLSAITIVTEADKMPKKGGVYSPGFAFAKTSLQEKLNDNSVTFKIISKKNI